MLSEDNWVDLSGKSTRDWIHNPQQTPSRVSLYCMWWGRGRRECLRTICWGKKNHVWKAELEKTGMPTLFFTHVKKIIRLLLEQEYLSSSHTRISYYFEKRGKVQPYLFTLMILQTHIIWNTNKDIRQNYSLVNLSLSLYWKHIMKMNGDWGCL